MYSSLPYDPIQYNSNIEKNTSNPNSSVIDEVTKSITNLQHILQIAERDISDKLLRSSTRAKHSSTLTKIRGREKKTVISGIISIRVPEADINNWRKLNLIGIVLFKINTHGCSLFAVMDNGILSKNANSKLQSDLYITPDKFEI